MSVDNNGVEDLGKGGMPIVGIPVKLKSTTQITI